MLNFSDLKVLVIGDICLDIVNEGNSYRLAPESPTPVILNPTKNYSLGMAGNVAVNLKNLGADVHISTLIGEVGKFETNKILELLDKHKIKHNDKKITSHNDYRTIVKERIIANKQQIARIDEEVKIKDDDKLFLNGLKESFNFTTDFDFIIISDYNKGFINKSTWSIMKPILEKHNKNGVFFVDTKKLDVLNYYEGMYIFPNIKEMQDLLIYNNCSTRGQLRKELDINFIVETASEDGAFIYNDDGIIIHGKSFKTNVSTIYGAGDVFMAAFSLCYAKYKNNIRALTFANYCCSKAVSKKNKCIVELDEVSNFEEVIK